MPKNGLDLSSPGKRTDYTNLEEAKLVHIDRRREASTQRERGEGNRHTRYRGKRRC